MKPKEVIELYRDLGEKLHRYRDQYCRLTEEEICLNILGRLFHVPKWRRHLIIEELMILGWIIVDGKYSNNKRIFKINYTPTETPY